MITSGLKRLGMAGASDWESAAASLARLAPPDTAMLPPPEAEGALWQAPRKQVGCWECVEHIAHVPPCVPGA